MHLGTLNRLRSGGSWKKLIAGIMAIVILPAVPAAALTFTGGWLVKTKANGGAPTPIVVPTDPSAGTTTLLFSFGQFNSAKKASTSITATRTFTLGAGETAVGYQESLISASNSFIEADRTLTVSIKKGVIKVTMKLNKTKNGRWSSSPESLTFTGV